MNIVKVETAQKGAKKAFELIKEGMAEGAKVLGLATGSTPIPLYAEMTASDQDFSEMTSINLDEYVGLPASNPASYHYFMHEQLFAKKPFQQSFIPNGMEEDAAKECAHYDQILADHPIDIQILGIGRNGHIGFNEPGTPFSSTTHKVQLTESTIEANKRFFDTIEEVPTFAYSMGIASILQSKKIILMAFGEEKAEAVNRMINEPSTEDLPASALQNHDNVVVIVDEQAGKLL